MSKSYSWLFDTMEYDEIDEFQLNRDWNRSEH